MVRKHWIIFGAGEKPNKCLILHKGICNSMAVTVANLRNGTEVEYGQIVDDDIKTEDLVDGNQMNCDIENLRCITNAQKIAMTRNEWWKLPKELKDVACTWLKLDTAIKGCDKERNNV